MEHNQIRDLLRSAIVSTSELERFLTEGRPELHLVGDKPLGKRGAHTALAAVDDARDFLLEVGRVFGFTPQDLEGVIDL